MVGIFREAHAAKDDDLVNVWFVILLTLSSGLDLVRRVFVGVLVQA